MNPRIIHTDTFAETAAQYIVDIVREDIKTQGRYVRGLCGGTTPRPVFPEVARRGKDIDWSKVYITFGDERCVPPDHADSNFRMAKEFLLNAINIPEKNVFRMQGELEPDVAAEKYEKALKEILPHNLLLLSIGADGHTASLFPESPALGETERLVVANYIEKFNAHRLTFTHTTINSSRRIAFLVNDAHKKNTAEEILGGVGNHPAGKVKGVEETTWILGWK